MAMINYKLNICRITLASKLFARNNYFPLFKIFTPQDATREIIKTSFTPKNHYMPVLLSHKKRERLSGGKKLKNLKTYGKRLHAKIDDFQYMNVMLNIEDDKHKKILDVLKTKKKIQGSYVYKIEDRNTCLVFDGQLEEAARNGDILDVTISDNTNRMIMRLKTGEKIAASAQTFLLEGIVYWGEASTTLDSESRHHYGKMIMNIARIFEMKERRAALFELEKIKFEAKKKQRFEREWKNGVKHLLENLVPDEKLQKENEQSKELQELEYKEYEMSIDDMNKTMNVSEKLINGDAINNLPVMKEINQIVKQIGQGRFGEMCGLPGVFVKIDDSEEKFIIGQMVQTDKEKIFVPGQTFETTNGVKYLPGITVNLDNTPTFVAGVIMADDKNSAVFLPGQSFITAEGKMRFTKEGERITPVGLKKLQMDEDEQWEKVEQKKVAREKLEKEKILECKRKKAKKEKLKNEKLKKEKENAIIKLSNEQEIVKVEVEDVNKQNLELINSEIQNNTQTNKIILNNNNNIEEPEKIYSNNNFADYSVPIVAEKTETLTELTETSSNLLPETEMATEGSLQQTSETMKQFNEEILAGIFLQDHKHLIDPELVEKDTEMMRAKCLKLKQDEERKKTDKVLENMKDVIDNLESKKTKLLEKLRNIQNETITVENKAVTYIYPAKANAFVIELGFDGQMGRNIAKILLGITRWASTFSAKFHVHSENIEILSYSSEIDEEFQNCSDNLKTALKAAMVAAVEVFKIRPKDLEGGMRAAGHSLTESINLNEFIMHEIALTFENKTTSERNVFYSSTLKDLTKKLIINKAETLRSIIREEFTNEKLVAKINLVIEEEGDILVRAFTNLTNNNPELCKKVYTNILNTASELLCEEKSGEAAHRAIVDAVQEIADAELNTFLSTKSVHDIKHLLSEGLYLANVIGMKNEAKTIDRLLNEEEDVINVHIFAADQITLDILRRVLIIRQLAERNSHLQDGYQLFRDKSWQARDHRNVRELIRESAALISHACPILSSMDIPSFLFELGDNLAMEDFLVQRIKQDGALLISKKGIQAVVPKEASRFVLAGLISYTLIDDKGVTTFKPMHVFNALKLGKAKERMYYEYSCVGAFDKYAYSVPVRETLDRNYTNPAYAGDCQQEICSLRSPSSCVLPKKGSSFYDSGDTPVTTAAMRTTFTPSSIHGGSRA